MANGNPPPPGWQPGPGAPQGPYGSAPGQFGQFGQFGPGGYGPPPPPSRGPKLWLAASGVVVVAAVVVIVVVLTGGSGGDGQQAGGTTPPPTSSSGAASAGTSTSPTSAGPTQSVTTSSPAPGQAVSVGPAPGQTAPTDDALPSNSGSSSCDQKGYPDLVTVSVVTVLGLAEKGETPNSYITNVLRDCTSATVRSRITSLFGTDLDYHTGSDLTGHDGQGATAVYLLRNKAGTESLRVTLTRQRDGHYEITSYVYTPAK